MARLAGPRRTRDLLIVRRLGTPLGPAAAAFRRLAARRAMRTWRSHASRRWERWLGEKRAAARKQQSHRSDLNRRPPDSAAAQSEQKARGDKKKRRGRLPASPQEGGVSHPESATQVPRTPGRKGPRRRKGPRKRRAL